MIYVYILADPFGTERTRLYRYIRLGESILHIRCYNMEGHKWEYNTLCKHARNLGMSFFHGGCEWGYVSKWDAEFFMIYGDEYAV